MRNHWALLSICCFACWEASAAGIEPSDVLVWNTGPFSFRPQLRLEEQFSDNIFYTEKNTSSDLVSAIDPGLRMLVGQDLPDEKHISLSYQMENDFYLNHSELDAIQHHIAHDSFYKTERFDISGVDRYDKLDSVLGAGINVGQSKVQRDQLLDIYGARYRFSERTRIHANIEHNFVDYESRQTLFDSEFFRGTVGFGWILSEKTDIFGEVYYGDTLLTRNASLTDPPDRTGMGGFVGATGDFTEKLRGVVKAGYDVSSFSSVGGTNFPAVGAPVFEMDLRYQVTEKSTFSLGYSRQQRASVQFFRSGYTVDDVLFGAGTTLGSAERLRLYADVHFAYFSYEPSPAYTSRDDTLIGFDFRATWAFYTWLSAQLSYSFENFDSSARSVVVNYQVNRIALALQVGY